MFKREIWKHYNFILTFLLCQDINMFVDHFTKSFSLYISLFRLFVEKIVFKK